MLAVVSPDAYGVACALAVAVCAGICAGARRRPGVWTIWVARCLGLLLVADAVSFVAVLVADGRFSARYDLPFALCDVAVLVAAAALWWRVPVLCELTWFWGLAGTLQAVITPDLAAPFPHVAFFQYLVGHLGIVTTALFLVVGLGIRPRAAAIGRVFAITLAYTAFVGVVDWLTDADYMFLRAPPGNWTLLRILGPWPWYVLSAAAVAFVLITVLDVPFWRSRHAPSSRARRVSTGSPLVVGPQRRFD